MDIKIEYTGMTNSARAIEGYKLNIDTLLKMENVNNDSIKEDIKFICKLDKAESDKWIETIVTTYAEKLYNIICVAKHYSKNYQIKD